MLGTSHLRVSASLSQTEADWLASMSPERYKVEMRRASRVHDVIEGAPTRIPVIARKDVPHDALLFQGGGTIASQQGADGRPEPTNRVFNAHFVAKADEGEAVRVVGLPGERVMLRFTLPSRPLLSQWLDRLEKALQGRAKV